jgi:DNA invertase Pin-like site-specific DNA recombinase
VSTTRQDTERQVADIDRWLARGGITAAYVWQDHGSRDKAEERPEFQAMLATVKSRGLDWIVIQSTDRLGFKDAYELFEFISIFRKHDVELWNALDGVCISHSDDRNVIMNAVAGLTSTREQLEKSNRTQTDRIRRASRGQHLGGQTPPYGTDVICIGDDGEEKWRYVLLEGHRVMTGRKPNGRPIFTATSRGLKVTPGNPEGEPCSHVPAHDRSELLYLSPTVKSDRIETLKRIFMLLDTEATNPSQVAARLNAEEVSPVVGERWTDGKIRDLVKNPACIGRPASNKKVTGRFHRVVGGRVERVTTAGPPKRRPREDWLMPDQPLFPPIIDPVLFERVNRKVASTGPRAPKSEQLYMSGLLYCSHCGEKMTGQVSTRRHKKSGEIVKYVFHYMCTTYRKHGAGNAAGCRPHHVQGVVVEPFIREFLARRGRTLDDLVGASRDHAAFEALLREKADVDSQARALLEKAEAFIDANEEVLDRWTCESRDYWDGSDPDVILGDKSLWDDNPDNVYMN